MDFAEEVLRQIGKLGLNINQAEARAGLPQGYIRGVLRGDDKRAVPNINKAETIAKALGLEFYIGPPRTEPPEPPVVELAGDAFTPIPRVDAEASAGPGALNDHPEVIGAMAFRSDWLSARGIRPAKALLVTVTGDSMSPHIAPGDLVLIDRARTQVQNGSPYIFTDTDGATKLKRLHKLDRRTLAIASDNPDYPTELRHGEDAARIIVIGQVIWSGRNWE